ncbi:competence/damage-inducible protein A [Phaeovulum vinaykumarii]|uniref:Molybdenum cofactor synthesis domain-containing protein n=1 Tax=Phaeovulum vinaykumarii TaxID=407234 RepID=A0A1N7K7K8_9RHOB|nr:molybdopterin-binding protein [Phaeovulum vinaykumarii]SIS57557.1 molybdenum cofactor synthesis domain-containing protein [Phaeovulum vinaykumarii]SOB93458.1 molybdenum cofactor synthesis domain-containing protein [Phaeovulum vinaykumarii]
MSNPTAAILIIGDEILSGRTREGNAHYLAGELVRAGIDLREIRVVGDVHETIVAAVKTLSAGHDHLFTSGGIGPTHDDITADAVAAAFGAPIGVRDDAREILARHYAARGLEFNEARLRMARIPEGARLIENPVSAAPGFSIGNCHVMAGVPNIFQAMVASVLPQLTGGAPLMSQSLTVMQAEASIADSFGVLAAEFPDLSMGSYPFVKDGAYGTNLVVRGTDAARIDAAMTKLCALYAEEA